MARNGKIKVAEGEWPPRRVVVDAVSTTRQMSGVGHYTIGCVSALIERLPDTEFHLFLGWSWSATLPQVRSGESNKSVNLSRVIRFARQVPGARALWYDLRAWKFRSYAKNLGAEVFFAANYIPPAPCDPVVPVVYDLSHMRMPGAHPAGRVRWLNRLDAVLDRAPAVVTISEFSKREIVELMGVAPERIFIAPPGVGEVFRPPAEAQRGEVLHRHGLEAGSYFLAIGNLEPRKNLKLLIEAYSRLPPRLRERHALVLGGGSGWGDAGLSDGLVQGLRRSGQLRLLGYVAGSDLPALYAGATAFCFPSLYEGFGMPVAEAMACQAPVLASNATSVPEAAGESGLSLDPHDVEAWTEALCRIVEDKALAARLRKLGPVQAAKFTWDACAESILPAFRHAMP